MRLIMTVAALRGDFLVQLPQLRDRRGCLLFRFRKICLGGPEPLLELIKGLPVQYVLVPHGAADPAPPDPDMDR